MADNNTAESPEAAASETPNPTAAHMSEEDRMAEAALYCSPHGEKHDAIACLRELAEESLAGGPWSIEPASCDCNEGMCSHGSWVHAIYMPNTHSQGDNKPCDKEAPLDSYRHSRSELSEFTWDEGHYLVAAQPRVVLALLDRLARAEALAASWEAEANHENGHPPLTQTYRNHARALRGVLADTASSTPEVA